MSALVQFQRELEYWISKAAALKLKGELIRPLLDAYAGAVQP